MLVVLEVASDCASVSILRRVCMFGGNVFNSLGISTGVMVAAALSVRQIGEPAP